jgi:hypothetical protein
MKHVLVVLVILMGLTQNLFSQTKVRKLPTSINHPSINVYAPFISADANAIVFISDNAEDNVLAPFYSFRENSDWKEPQMFPKNIYTRLIFTKGSSLSADGKKLFYTTMKSPGVGGFDICSSDWKGNIWGEPTNLGQPINSKGHEACASFTTDGSTIYFMRCEKMDMNQASNCKIFKSSKKPNGQWEEPIELPASINTGNSQTPRIMADAETLIFSSDKMGNTKGGMDLYATKFTNGNWSNPLPLDFANTDKDDQYISVAALGRYLLKESPGARKSEIVEMLIPNELRPKGMMKIEGKVSDPLIPSYVSIVDLNGNKKIYSGRPDKTGSFMAYIMEGSKYELAVDPEMGNVNYFTKQFDLTSDKIPQVEKVTANLKSFAPGDELSLDMVKFKPFSSDLDLNSSSTSELKRLLRAIKDNPEMKFEIQVLLSGYEEDSILSKPDLTEVSYDSVMTKYDEIDSLGQLYQIDTMTVKTIFHNDRTTKQAKAIIAYLVSQGADAGRVTFFVNAIPATAPENKRTTVKAALRKK